MAERKITDPTVVSRAVPGNSAAGPAKIEDMIRKHASPGLARLILDPEYRKLVLEEFKKREASKK